MGALHARAKSDRRRQQRGASSVVRGRLRQTATGREQEFEHEDEHIDRVWPDRRKEGRRRREAREQSGSSAP